MVSRIVLKILSALLHGNSARYAAYTAINKHGENVFAVYDRLIGAGKPSSLVLSEAGNYSFPVVCICESFEQAELVAKSMNITCGIKEKKVKLVKIQFSISACEVEMSKEGWNLFRKDSIAKGKIDPELADGWDAVWLTSADLQRYGVSSSIYL